MCGLRTQDRPLYTKPPSQLAPPDVGRVVRLDPERRCAACGRYYDVAQVVRRSDHTYDYACLGCAKKFPEKPRTEETRQ